MRIAKILAAAVAAVALTAGAAQAETDTSVIALGHVDWAQTDTNFGDDDQTNGGVSGAVAWAISGNWGAQVDADYTFVDEGDDVLSGTAHVFHRTAAGLVGGFIGAAKVDDDTAVGGGVELEHYADAWTVGGSLTYATVDDTDVDVWALQGHLRHYYSENLRGEVDLGYGNVDNGVNDDSVWQVGVGGAYQFASAPVSIGARLGYASFDDADVDVTSLSVSVGYTFTGESLQQRDRTGASQNGILGNLVGLF